MPRRIPVRATAPAVPEQAPIPEQAPVTPAQRHDGVTTERQRLFLETLAATGSVSRAAKACGLSRQALYAYRNRADVPAFRAAWDVAMSCAINILGDIAFDRAIEGVEEPVFWKGEQVGTRRRYSDNLLATLLRMRDPFTYGPHVQMRTLAGVRNYVSRPKLDGAIEALEKEATGTRRIRYDDDPGGPLYRRK